MIDKIKKFNLKHFKRSILKKVKNSKDISYFNLFLSEKSNFLNSENRKYFNEIKSTLERKKTPFDLTKQEFVFLDRHKCDKEKCIDYLLKSLIWEL